MFHLKFESNVSEKSSSAVKSRPKLRLDIETEIRTRINSVFLAFLATIQVLYIRAVTTCA